MGIRPLYDPHHGQMRVAVFSSGWLGTFRAALDAAADNAAAMKVVLLVSDRLGTACSELARRKGMPVIERDFAAELGKLEGAARSEASDRMHDEMLGEIKDFEQEHGAIDLVVLTYNRIIRGAMFSHFRDCMINQHPADLTAVDDQGARRYTGFDGLARSIRDGVAATRTSTILVTEGVDEGEILGQGPWVPVNRSKGYVDVKVHELLQEQQSDWPILTTILQLICVGRLGLDDGDILPGCRQVYLDEQPLPCGGVQI